MVNAKNTRALTVIDIRDNWFVLGTLQLSVTKQQQKKNVVIRQDRKSIRKCNEIITYKK